MNTNSYKLYTFNKIQYYILKHGELQSIHNSNTCGGGSQLSDSVCLCIHARLTLSERGRVC